MLTLGMCLSAAVVLAADAPKKSTPDEARALLDKAVAEVQKAGEKKALAEFNDTRGSFTQGDLYVFCFGADNKTTAHPKLAPGTDITTLKDEDGKEFGKALAAAGQKGGGAVEYKWLNPATNKVEAKVSFVKKAGSQVCGVGAYK
jgi:signal transduction histidine kinase